MSLDIIEIERRICAHCRHWDDQALFSDGGSEYRACLNERLRASPGCEPGDVFVGGSGITTTAEFGCNQFEARA